MNKDNVKLWIDALRSGRYLQGRFQLKDRLGKHCCLGVLCDVHAKTTGEGSWVEYMTSTYRTTDGSSSYGPPLPVVKWLAGEDNEEFVEFANALANVNDGGLVDFAVIATMIETRYLSESNSSESGESEE